MELGVAELVLALAALLIGATGTWSPCGFSMVETLGPTGHTGGRPTTLAACASFLPGALVGGVMTFGGLAALGGLVHGAGGAVAYAIAAVVALLAAVAEARGARIAPQIRRQLPEHWRRIMPMPVAAALYGVLLGLGFTTFVLTFGVWALAGIAFAVAEPLAGLLIGLGFGIGRALPVVALAPLADRPAGQAAIGLMAERPGIYRGIRLGDAAALLGVALVLAAASTEEAGAGKIERAADPVYDAGTLVYQGADGSGFIRDGGGGAQPLPGTDPAVGGGYVAVLRPDAIEILDRKTLAELRQVQAPGVDAVAISPYRLVYRTHTDGRDTLKTRRLRSEARLGAPRKVADVGSPNQLSRPSVYGNRVVFAVAKSKVNRIVLANLKSGKRRTVARSVKHALSNPTLRQKAMVYVRAAKSRQRLMIKRLGKASGQRVLLSERARLWSTALGPKQAWVTVLSGKRPRSEIITAKR